MQVHLQLLQKAASQNCCHHSLLDPPCPPALVSQWGTDGLERGMEREEWREYWVGSGTKAGGVCYRWQRCCRYPTIFSGLDLPAQFHSDLHQRRTPWTCSSSGDLPLGLGANISLPRDLWDCPECRMQHVLLWCSCISRGWKG